MSADDCKDGCIQLGTWKRIGDTMEYTTVDEFLKATAKDIEKWPEYGRAAAGTGDDYKLRLREKVQFMHTISDARNVITSFKTQQQYPWWSVGEILSEVFAMNPPLMNRYRPDLIESSYKLRDDKSVEYMYGRRWSEFNEILNTIDVLAARLDSKRAVVPIFTPYDTDPTRKDVPCTLMYTFKIRDNKVNMTSFYRSHDFFGGLKYDYILSSFMCQLITMGVNAKNGSNLLPGKLNMYDDSLHVYVLKDNNKLIEYIKEAENVLQNQSSFNVMYSYGSVKDMYEDLWRVHDAETSSYWANFDAAKEKIEKINNPAFADFARIFYNRNVSYKQKKENKIDDSKLLDYETHIFRW